MLAQIQLAGKSSGLKFIHAMKSAVAVIHKVQIRGGGPWTQKDECHMMRQGGTLGIVGMNAA